MNHLMTESGHSLNTLLLSVTNLQLHTLKLLSHKLVSKAASERPACVSEWENKQLFDRATPPKFKGP